MEALCFLISGAAIFAGLGFSIWSASSGLVMWSDVWWLSLIFCIGVSPLLIFGIVLRWNRRHKAAALSEYERILALGYKSEDDPLASPR
jgi:hypothetical protein